LNGKKKFGGDRGKNNIMMCSVNIEWDLSEVHTLNEILCAIITQKYQYLIFTIIDFDVQYYYQQIHLINQCVYLMIYPVVYSSKS